VDTVAGYRDCIADQLKAGKISRAKRDEALKRYDNLYDAHIARGMAPYDAALQAGQEAVLRATIEHREAVKRRIAHALAAFRVEQEIVANKTISPGRVAQAMVDHDPGVPVQSYAALRDVVRGQLTQVMRELIEKYQPRMAGIVHPRQGLDDLLDEIFALAGRGRDTGNAEAKALAKAWADTTDLGVDLWNLSGGTLLKRADWLVPQQQSRWRLARAGEKAWVDAHMRWLDWDAMRHSDGRPMPRAEADRRKLLNDIFATIKTDGANNLSTRSPGRGSLGNTFDESRFLIYRDADAWKEAHAQFGEGNLYQVMITHLEDRAHRIAMLKRFGPNPEMMRDIVKAAAMHVAGQRDAAVTGPMTRFATSQTESQLTHFEAMFDIASRHTKMSADSTPGHIMAGVRNILTSAYLGSASLAAIPGDLVTTAMTRYFDAMPMTGGIREYLRGMNPLDKEHQAIGLQAGFVNESALAMAYSATRFNGLNTYGPSWTRRVSDVVLRASLLTPHTQAARLATELEFLGLMTRDRGKAFSDLPYREVMERNGIDAADWDAFRAIPTWKPRDGVEFLRPSDIFAHVGDRQRAMLLHDKIMVAVINQSKMMVPDSTLFGAAVLRGSSKPGTLVGEIMNSFAMFKNFPITIAHLYGRRGMLEASGIGRASYAAAFIIAMTGAGAMAVQMREVAQGRDPVDMGKGAFWGQAMLTGGSMGIWGDFLFANLNRFGHGPAETIAGPVFTTGKEWLDLTLGNLLQLARGEETDFLPEAVRVARRALPGSSIWYARLAIQRLIFDQLQAQVDPRAYHRWRRDEVMRMRDKGQGYWWAPGDTAPRRAPLG
jgi:hypothetical protein